MSKLDHYPPQHPAAIALGGLFHAMASGRDLLRALAEQAECVGVEPWSEEFDEAARLVGYFYSRPLDLYVSREEFEEAERRPLAHVH